MSRRSCKGLGTLLLIVMAVVGCGGESLRADAGDDFSVAIGEGPRFDGCGSEGEILRYEWIIRQAPPAGADAVGTTLDSSDTCVHTVDAMVTDDVGSWTIELVVTDAQGAISNDEVTVTVTE